MTFCSHARKIGASGDASGQSGVTIRLPCNSRLRMFAFCEINQLGVRVRVLGVEINARFRQDCSSGIWGECIALSAYRRCRLL